MSVCNMAVLYWAKYRSVLNKTRTIGLAGIS